MAPRAGQGLSESMLLSLLAKPAPVEGLLHCRGRPVSTSFDKPEEDVGRRKKFSGKPPGVSDPEGVGYCLATPLRKGLVVDVETTGFNKTTDEIVEMALILFEFDQRGHIHSDSIEEYAGLREPACSISAGAASVHGLTVEELAGLRLDGARITSMVRRTEFHIAHNASFDQPFVERLYPIFRSKPWYCSMRGVDWARQGCRSRSLQSLACHYQIDPGREHRALADARTTLALLDRVAATGRSNLWELMERGRGRPGWTALARDL